jgi:hypothetical protein
MATCLTGYAEILLWIKSNLAERPGYPAVHATRCPVKPYLALTNAGISWSITLGVCHTIGENVVAW